MSRLLSMWAAVCWLITPLPAGAEAAVPELVQSKCFKCHRPDLVTEKPHRPMPLRGVFGKQATVVEGGWLWDEAHLRLWLSKPHGGPRQAVRDFTGDPVAKTTMGFPGLDDSAQIDTVVEFLKHYQ